MKNKTKGLDSPFFARIKPVNYNFIAVYSKKMGITKAEFLDRYLDVVRNSKTAAKKFEETRDKV